MEVIFTAGRTGQLRTTSIYQPVLTYAVPVLLGTVLGANIITMSLMNFLELETAWLLPIYFGAAILTAGLLLLSGIKFPDIQPRDHVFSLLLASLFLLPRVMYLFESSLGYAIDPYHDDWGHIQYLASIIDSPRFPPRSTYDDSQFLSYYYAPWILGAALRQTGLFSTVKQVLALTDLAYATFASYSVVYASKILFQERNLQKTFLLLCIFYGGFDFLYWLLRMDMTLPHEGWWAADLGISLQYSNFFILVLWVPQHVAATMALLYGLYTAATSTGILARFLAGLFLAAAAFSSPFVVFGAVPLGIVLLVQNKLPPRALWILVPTFTLLALPLFWIFLGKNTEGFVWFGELGPFLIKHKRAGFIVFTAVTLLQLGPIFWASRVAITERLATRWLLLASSAFILSIFFIHYYAGNYCLRGAIIPTFTLMYVATPGCYKFFQDSHGRWYRAALITYLLGGLYEYASFSAVSLEALQNSRTRFNSEALASNSSPAAFVDTALLQEAKMHSLGWYVLEKRKAIPEEPLPATDAATLHGDNSYRFTLSSIVHRLKAQTGTRGAKP